MNLLYRNDKQGAFPDSWYAATAHPREPAPQLRGDAKADVCIVGGGFTGLSAAVHLAERGYNVALIEAHRVGFGASGRNGGQLGSGQRSEQDTLEKLVGDDDAMKLWQLAEEAKELVKYLISKHNISCSLKPGIAHACFTSREVQHEHRYVDHLQSRYDYEQVKPLNAEELHAICPSPRYKGGSLDTGAAHLHPLNYALGLAKACENAGVTFYENTHVHNIVEGETLTIRCDTGRLRAKYLILACNGYLGGLNRRVAGRVMPINNFIAATEPLGDDAAKVLSQDIAVADSKFVVNYFRLSDDNRLLFGGGESYGYKFPDIDKTVRKPLADIFPHLQDVKFGYTWGGTLAITLNRLPYLARLAPNILSASGYSGHGVGTATHAGKLMADAIAGQAESFDIMAKIPTNPFPGGPALRSPLLTLAMTWYALRDKLGV